MWQFIRRANGLEDYSVPGWTNPETLDWFLENCCKQHDQSGGPRIIIGLDYVLSKVTPLEERLKRVK